MKLLFVIDRVGSGGGQRQMVTLATQHQMTKHSVEFFVYHPHLNHFEPELKRASVVVNRYPKASRFSMGVLGQLAKVIKGGEYDGVLSFLETPNLYCEILRSIHVIKTPLVVSERLSQASDSFSLASRVKKQFHRFADHVTVNSQHQHDGLVRAFPWLRRKLSTIYNGVDFQIYHPRTRPRDDHSKQIRLLGVGTITSRKNVTGLIHALSEISESDRSRLQVNWAGKVDASQKGSRYFAEAKKLIQDRGVGNCWRWLGERNDVPELLREHDALIHPSFLEGLPNAICEAMASGLPVLAANVCDNAVLLDSGQNRLLFDPNNPADIARSIVTFAHSDSNERNAWSVASLERAKRLFSMEALARSYVELFDRRAIL